jgi:cell division protease FtsH
MMRKGLKKAVEDTLKALSSDKENSGKKGKESEKLDKAKNQKRDMSKIPVTFMIKYSQPKRWYKNPFLWIIIVIIIFSLIAVPRSIKRETQVSLGDIVSMIKNDEYQRVDVSDTKVILRTKDKKIFSAYIPSKDKFQDILKDEGVSLSKSGIYYTPPAVSWVDTLSNIVSLLMIGGIIFFTIAVSKQVSQSGSTLLGMGESRAKVWLGRKQDIGFKDVAGIDEAVEEVKEIVEFLKYPERFRKVGARIPKGVLIVGPPGTGKTLLARAIAGEAGVPFFFTSGAEFEEMLVGAGASRVRDLFAKAKKAAPAIIFIDEIDAVGRKRGTVLHTGTAEQTLNQILVEMDGFDRYTNVIVIAATNRPDVLDPALLRPGRFDRIIVLDLPDIAARKAILSVHARGRPFADDVDFDQVARRTVGFSGADLENVLNEAAILAVRKGREKIEMEDISEAIVKVQLGPAKKRIQTDKERKMIAYHEAGHALVSYFTPEADEIVRVSIVSRGMSLGATEKLPKEEHERIRAKSKLEADITTLIAGHVAEKIAFGQTSTGAEEDIRQATKIARDMVTKYGMSDLGPVEFMEGDEVNKYLGYDYRLRPFSEKTAAAVDDQVLAIINKAYKRAENILIEKRKKLDEVVASLLDKETLDAREFKKIVES